MIRLTAVISALLAAGLCAAATPLIEPSDTPRGETVLEPIRYSVPSIGKYNPLWISAFPLDGDRVLLSVGMAELRTTAPGSSLPLVIADLDDNSKSIRERLHPGVRSFSSNGGTAALTTSALARNGWPTRLWVIELETWRAIELLETIPWSDGSKRDISRATVSPNGRLLLVSFSIYGESGFPSNWELFNIDTGEFTRLARLEGHTDTLLWAPDGQSIYRSYRTRTAEEKSGFGITIVDRLGLDGSELGELVPASAVLFTLRSLSSTGSHATIGAEPGDGDRRSRVAMLDLSNGQIIELDDERARAGGGDKWNANGNSFILFSGGGSWFEPEPNHIFEIGLDGQTIRHWEIDDHQITDVFWMPGRDDPYAVTTRGEIYLLHGDGDNTFRRRVWSIHRSPLRNP